MDDMHRQRPQSRGRPQSRPEATQPVPPAVPARVKRGGWWKWPAMLILLVIILYIVSLLTPVNIFGLGRTSDNWKAVFLTSGETYFGRLINERTDPLVLRDIYYLQVSQALQQVKPGETPLDLNQSEIPLRKLGNELHGPLDEMRINKEHVLFVEDLKNDGRVVQAIEAFKKSNQ